METSVESVRALIMEAELDLVKLLALRLRGKSGWRGLLGTL